MPSLTKNKNQKTVFIDKLFRVISGNHAMLRMSIHAKVHVGYMLKGTVTIKKVSRKLVRQSIT
jgi:hypothetical protein